MSHCSYLLQPLQLQIWLLLITWSARVRPQFIWLSINYTFMGILTLFDLCRLTLTLHLDDLANRTCVRTRARQSMCGSLSPHKYGLSLSSATLIHFIRTSWYHIAYCSSNLVRIAFVGSSALSQQTGGSLRSFLPRPPFPCALAAYRGMLHRCSSSGVAREVLGRTANRRGIATG